MMTAGAPWPRGRGGYRGTTYLARQFVIRTRCHSRSAPYRRSGKSPEVSSLARQGQIALKYERVCQRDGTPLRFARRDCGGPRHGRHRAGDGSAKRVAAGHRSHRGAGRGVDTDVLRDGVLLLVFHFLRPLRFSFFRSRLDPVGLEDLHQPSRRGRIVDEQSDFATVFELQFA